MTKRLPSLTAPRHPAWTDNPLVVAGLILAVVTLAWGGSLSAPFEFDDHASIIDNASIRHLVPPAWLHPPATAGETVSGRPVLNFTFAVNHALGGLNVRGYRLVNVLIHACAGLLLWGVLRRIPAVGGAGVALAVALIWVVHPLQTAAVTYVVQRAEVLAGLLGLLAIYGFIRGSEAGAPQRWFVLSLLSCLAGVGTKETVAVIPVVILLYDRAFVAQSFRLAWQKRGWIHAGLFATWLPLAALVWMNRARGGSAGTGAMDAGAYALTQTGAIVHYLRLVFWPAGQVFDYGVATVTGFSAVAGPGVLLAALVAGTLWQLARNRPLGFAGACFFLLLAPSSSVVPVVTQTIAEHRMYLALAIPVLLGGVAIHAGLRRFVWAPRAGGVVAGAVILVLAAATISRNRVYQSELSLWSDTVAKRPGNPRAHYNLGLGQLAAGRKDEAVAEFRRTLELQPNHAFAHFQLGNAALTEGQAPSAIPFFEAALAADPRYTDARVNLGQALVQAGRSGEAVAQFRQALADDPAAADVRVNLAAVLLSANHVTEAETLLREALARAPDLPEAHYQMGLAFARATRTGEAEAEFRRALELRPGWAAAHLALGNSAAARGEATGADAAYREALRLDPRLAEAHFARGNLFAKQQRFAEAVPEYLAALELDPAHVQARNNLANCQLVTGRFDDAIANYEAVLRGRPGDTAVLRNLALAREQQQR